ncbi:hypothetical protein LA76x_1508 [Lysobacter antibioticus]|uniref:Uncharacterized protein n=1 Tax=Lysobacter antibioticus TaxID=84531 RepID=A0A0S2F804_LYSAN|nr:hypothetical protein LA76x_1508 [Lysobacter antibioticus]
MIFHTGHPCPDEKRRASLRAGLRVFTCIACTMPRTATATVTMT